MHCAADRLCAASIVSNPLDNTNAFARPSAMGSAFAGVADDASALFSNPGGLAFLEHGQLMANSQLWLAQTNQEAIVLGFPGPRGWGGGAIAGTYLDFGTLEGRDDLGSLTSSYKANRWSFKGGWAVTPVRDLGFGAAFQATHGSLAGRFENSSSADIGLLARLSRRVWGGFSYNHWGSAKGGETPAADFQAGLSGRLPLGEKSRLLAALGMSWEKPTIQGVQAGLEYAYNSRYFLRAGYHHSTADVGIDGVKGLTAGCGISMSGIQLDYALLPYGDLGLTHRISMGYGFGKIREPQTAGVQASSGGTARASKSASRQDGRNPSLGTKALHPTADKNSNQDTFIPSTVGGAKPKAESKMPSLDSLPGNPPSQVTGSGTAETSTDGAPDSKAALDSGLKSTGVAQPKAANDLKGAAGKALQLSFDLAPDSLDQGIELEKQGKYKEAAVFYQGVVQQDPKNAAAWWAMGNIYKRFNRIPEAIHCYEEVLKLEPNHADLRDWVSQNKGAQP